LTITPHNLASLSVPSLTSAADGYGRWAPIYDRSPNPLLAREERYLFPLLADARGKRIIDIACGTGRWIEKLATHVSESCVGVDCSAAMLEIANAKHLAGRLTRATCEGLPFANEIFDVAICSFALGHITDIESFAVEVFRVSKPGADFFLTDLHPVAYEQGWRVGFRDERAAVEIETIPRQADEIMSVFSSSGFKGICHESLWLEAPERSIFARAGKEDRFASASQVPAIIAFHLRRSHVASDIGRRKCRSLQWSPLNCGGDGDESATGRRYR